MKITKQFIIFLYRHTPPIVAHAGLCRQLLSRHAHHVATILSLPNLNNVDTSPCNEPS